MFVLFTLLLFIPIKFKELNEMNEHYKPQQ